MTPAVEKFGRGLVTLAPCSHRLNGATVASRRVSVETGLLVKSEVRKFLYPEWGETLKVAWTLRSPSVTD